MLLFLFDRELRIDRAYYFLDKFSYTNFDQEKKVSMSELEAAPITLTVKVLQATNCKGSKASLNSFVRVQFADFDYKDVF